MTGCAFDRAGNLVTSPAATLYRVNLGSLTATGMSANSGTTWGDLATAPGRQADLSVTKTASNLTPGNTVTFTVNVTNSGSVTATGVQVRDLLPAGLTVASSTVSAGTYTAATGLWDINVLNSGATATLTITANVTTAGAKTNTAQVSFADQFDPDSVPNNGLATEDDQASVTITPSPDLQLSKTTTTGFAIGAIGTYSISVNNTLGSSATVGNYTVSDTLPAGLTLAAPPPSGSGWSCTGAVGDSSFTCVSSSVIAASATNPNPITINVLAAAAAAPSATNTATISGGGEPASNTGNNSSSVTHAVCATACPDLRLTKTGPASFSVGVNGSYSIAVNNTSGGITTTASYTVTDTLPTGITLAAPLPAGTGWTCSGGAVGGSTFSCMSSTAINAGASNPNLITVNVAVANTAAPSVTNTANVTGGGEPTTTQGNNSGSAVTPTNSVGTSYSGVNFGDVRPNIFNTDGSQNGMAGSTVNYPHSFTANTTGTVTFATSNIASPNIAGWTNTNYRDTDCNGVLDGTEGAASFSGATMSAGQTICIVVKEFIPASAPNSAQDTITVTAAFVYANASPALSTNYLHSDITTVAGSAGLTLAKSVDKGTALPSEVLTYTITYTNNGSAPITSVVISDSTPAFTSYVGGSAGCPNLIVRTSCTVSTEPANGATGSLSWTITGSVGPSASSTVRFQVRVQP